MPRCEFYKSFTGEQISNFNCSNEQVDWYWKHNANDLNEKPSKVIIIMKNIILVKRNVIHKNKVNVGSSSNKIFVTNIYAVCSIGKNNLRLEEFTLKSTASNTEKYYRMIKVFLQFFVKRPKSLIVFINPYGGRKRAEHSYNEIVAPIFNLVGISTKVVVTKQPNECKEYLLKEDLTFYDGVISVGGDGFVSELLHGLLYRTRAENNLPLFTEHTPELPEISPSMRIGLIPAGSTNAILVSTHGTEDVITAALHIVLGEHLGIDVLSIHDGLNKSFLRYTISLLGYGFHGEILRPSEAMRFFGPVRYDIAGFFGWLKLSSYKGKISYLPSSNTDSHPLDGSLCSFSCKVCSQKENNHSKLTFTFTEMGNVDSGKKDSCFIDEGDCSNYLSNYSLTGYSDHNSSVLDENSSSIGWKTLSGEFLMINIFPISCRCAKATFGASPSAHLGDGYADLVVVRKCNRFSFLKYLVLLSSQTMSPGNQSSESSHGVLDNATNQVILSSHLRLPFVDVYRVKAVTFTPFNTFEKPFQTTSDNGVLSLNSRSETNGTSVWCVDGEVLHQPNISCFVHRKLINLFGRGPMDR